MTTDDDWVKLAMTDDSVVAELLSRLGRHGKPPTPPPPPPPSPPLLALRLDWSVRQRRSRAPTRHHHSRHHHHHHADLKRKKNKKEKGEPRRASPTTPLSWSGATSVSGGGSEESSKPTSLAGGTTPRSKVCIGSEPTTGSKRPRKKKTLAELKEEETFLLKERKKLRKEIETMRLNVQKQRAANESLGRLKLDFESQLKLETVNEHSSIPPTTNSPDALQHALVSSVSCKAKEVESRVTGFSLPDLNLPVDGDLHSSASL